MAVLGLLSLAETLEAPGGIPWEWLIVKVFDFVANYVWRIVLFTVLLKFVLLPLDLYQKHCMRKNQRITERLKPEMEKLQKAYGHDKQMFAQKQMELNKREGFSYFSSFLPMILTLVIFIWLWNSMRLISEFMIFRQYVEWDDRYQLVQGYLTDEDHFYRAADNDSYVYKMADGQILALNDEGQYQTVNDKGGFVKPEDGGVKYTKNDDGSFTDSNGNVLNTEGMELYCWASEAEQSRVQSIVAAAIHNYNATLAEGVTPLPETDVRPGMSTADWTGIVAVVEYTVNDVSQQAVADFYAGEETNRQDFLWIASVWRPDVPWEKPIGSHSAFINSIGRYAEDAGRSGITAERLSQLIASDNYNSITGRLAAQEDRANGYLVLPILSVGLSFLSYFISQRQQKKAGQAPVEGAAGAGAMKFMMILMPLMMGFFALTYSAAFTLYMVVNSSTTIIINLLSSFILDIKDKIADRKAAATVQKYGRPDPNAGPGGDKKQKGAKDVAAVQKYGRPDPNAPKEADKAKADKPSKLPKKLKRR